jgi:hypothetical protein
VLEEGGQLAQAQPRRPRLARRQELLALATELARKQI